jgi:dihydrofolate reductase
MRKIIYWVHTSVDGFVDGPNGEFDWPVMGPELSAYSEALDRRVDTLLFGRPVWQMMVGFWPNAEAISQDPHVVAFATFWRATPKIVFPTAIRATSGQPVSSVAICRPRSLLSRHSPARTCC